MTQNKMKIINLVLSFHCDQRIMHPQHFSDFLFLHRKTTPKGGINYILPNSSRTNILTLAFSWILKKDKKL